MPVQQPDQENCDHALERDDDIFYKGLSNETQHLIIYSRGQAKIQQYLDMVGDDEQVSLGKMFAIQLRKFFEKTSFESNNVKVESHTTPEGWEMLRKVESDPRFGYSKIPSEFLEAYKESRINLIRFLISQNVPVPDGVIQQYPKGFFEPDFISKPPDQKARWTTEANRTGREDDSLVANYGVMLRKQDGKKVEDKIRDQLKRGLDEIIDFFPDLPEVCRVTPLTIIHTGGKNVYRKPRYVRGIYNKLHKTITLGVADEHGEPDIHSLGHELLGHWLDHICVPNSDILEISFGGSVRDRHNGLTVSYLDALDQEYCSALFGAAQSMIPSRNKPTRSLAYARPSEIFARLMEQCFSIWLFKKGNEDPVSAYPLTAMLWQPQFWAIDDWQKWLYHQTLIEYESRRELARQSNGLSINKPDNEIYYRHMLPWSEGHSVKQSLNSEISQ